ncbi:MAG: hypothetical protein WBG46_04280 [Nonlabens sp.]
MICINFIGLTNNMRKIILILSLISTCFFVNAQDQKEETKEYYMSLKSFRQIVTDTVDIDHLDYIINNGDTLVPYKRQLGKGDNDLKNVKYILKDTTFLSIYKHIAYRSINDKDPRHRYWKDEIVVYFGETVPKGHQRFLKRFIRKNLSDINHLKIKTTRTIEQSNFIIYYDGGFEYEGRFKNDYAKRKNYYTYWNDGKINKVVLKLIPEFYNGDKAILSDLVRGLITNLGYFNRVAYLDCNSIFSNCQNLIENLSQLDKEILKYHYSYGFCVGMTLDFFEEQDATAREFYRLNPESDYPVLYHPENFPKN